MKHLKKPGLTALAAFVLMAIGAASASATTLEVNGVAQNQSVAMSASLESGTSTLLKFTDGTIANTCTESSASGATSTFTASSSGAIGGPVSALSFTGCTSSPVTVDVRGSLSVEWISGTTNGTVRSVGAEVTVAAPPFTLTCRTGTGVDIGTVTGKATGGHATVDISAVLNCGFPAPSMTWVGSYVVTSPTGLGILK